MDARREKAMVIAETMKIRRKGAGYIVPSQTGTGSYAVNAPDLLVNFRPGFRVSWQSAVGGFQKSLIEDNQRKWSGDHIIDPESVPGILFMNTRPAAPGAPPSIIDLAPTILNHLGVPVPEIMEGRCLI